MLKYIRKIRRNDDGATAIEYGLIAALIAIALITALGNLGDTLGTFFGTVETEVSGAAPGAGAE